MEEKKPSIPLSSYLTKRKPSQTFNTNTRQSVVVDVMKAPSQKSNKENGPVMTRKPPRTKSGAKTPT